MNERIAILGCGPAALMTAHTLVSDGIDEKDIDIFSYMVKPSPIGGAQFLHAPLDAREPADGLIKFERLGQALVYAEKVYGEPTMATSWDAYREQRAVPAWGLQRIYTGLWQEWNHRVSEFEVTPHTMEQFRIYDKVFSTVPPQCFCKGGHKFPSARIKLAHDEAVAGDNIVRYNGMKDTLWYRESSIFGHRWREYGGHVPLGPGEWNVEGKKPLGTECNCHGWAARVGRFGRWDRAVLLHHVPDQVRLEMAA